MRITDTDFAAHPAGNAFTRALASLGETWRYLTRPVSAGFVSATSEESSLTEVRDLPSQPVATGRAESCVQSVMEPS